MKSIRDINIKKMFPPVVYRRGVEYYHNDLVSDVLYDINFNVWTATVHGSESYFVEINTSDFSKGSISAYCDCPAFSTYGTCKHIAAVLLAISAKDTGDAPWKMSRDYRNANRLIDSITGLSNYQSANETVTAKSELNVEYYMEWTYEGHLLLQLKVGEQRCLVVKNVEQFLQDVWKKNEHYFTKTFTYYPDHHYFAKEDIEILELIYSVIRNEQIYSDRSRLMDSSERSVVIPPLLIKQLLHLLVERNFTVKVKQRHYMHVTIVENDVPFQFKLAKNAQGELLLTIDELGLMHYFPPYELLFLDGVFYFPEKEQLPIVEQITKLSGQDEQLPITKEQADTFVSEVLPSLKKIGDVNIDETVAAEIVQVPLHAKLFLELQEDWIVGRLEYHYGEYTIDPFTGRKQEDAMIIRDVEKEQQIMHLIEYANFHYNGKELYIEIDEETLYEFLYNVLPVLDNYVELYLTSDIRQFIVEQAPSPKSNVKLEGSSNLLEIGFDIDGVKDDEINYILQALMEKKRYYRLQTGQLLSLEGEEFQTIKQLFDDLDVDKNDLQDGNIKMPVYRGAQVDELMDMKKHYDPAFRQLLHQLKSPEEQVYPLPENLNATLRDYQMTGYQWFKSLSAYHLGGILADDMGLGKTLQSIAYVLSEPGETPHLIIAPSSVLYNWKNEFEHFAPDLNVAVLTGTPHEREKMIAEYGDKDVWITSYATLRQDIALYKEKNFQTMILDEAQYIKNYQTKTSRAIREVSAKRRFALSGTPIENSIDELWAIFQVILPGLMPNQQKFKQLSHEKIASLTKPFILRRLKKDVLRELPDKIETVHVSELTKEQKQIYVGYWRRLQQEAAQSIQQNDFQQNRMKILAGLTRLRQICCHPAVFLDNYEGESGKLNQLMETIQNALENGKRMLIFSQFTSMHEIIGKKLEEAGISYFYLHGQTASQERVEMSQRFNDGEKDVFLISLKAGGTGLNLTGADTVILYDLWWNPAVEDQATGRAHRFGQKQVVQVIRLITEGTIEEKIYELQQKKRELIDQVIQPGETMLSSLSEQDIKELLRI